MTETVNFLEIHQEFTKIHQDSGHSKLYYKVKPSGGEKAKQMEKRSQGSQIEVGKWPGNGSMHL